jgi:hypothetical protein
VTVKEGWPLFAWLILAHLWALWYFIERLA